MVKPGQTKTPNVVEALNAERMPETMDDFCCGRWGGNSMDKNNYIDF
jgi:hypothetical protein